ncbi:MAG TPA: HAD hydrolase family protein [Lacipirellulaceae bacterium]|nr:HAD hydrolase family protein [Lacipirellulaceae bacterium]
MKLTERCAAIRLLLTDVDGVLTGGGVTLDNQGVESKTFHIRDGLAVRLWQHAGGRTGVVTGRSSQVVKLRAAGLEMDVVRQGVKDKLPEVQAIAAAMGIPPEQIAYVGDDLPDIPVIRYAGLGVAVADAPEEVRAAADYVTSVAGGCGAVREVVELLLKNTGQWDAAIRKFGA